MNFHVSRLLIQRLERPDGRPLYKFKIDDETYRLLNSYLSTTQHTRENILFWSGMFTLFAVEWWRREYDGGYWEWHPIFNAIKKGNLDDAQFRQLVIEKGFQYWRRKIQVHSSGNKSYLGSIYAECGIPNFALQADHYLSNIITQSFKRLSIVNISEYDSLQIVKEIADKKLPLSLQQEVSYKLLKDITNELISLKDKYNLGDESNPSAYLDDNSPGWRESFPIQMSEIGNKFIDSLLSEVQKIKTTKPHQIRFVHRLINRNEIYVIQSQLSFPDKSLSFESLGMDEGKFSLFSNKARIFITSSNGTRQDLGYAFRNQDIGFRINIKEVVDLPENAHLEDWKVILLDTVNHEEFEIEIPFAEAFQPDTPWIFTAKENSWLFKAEGSVKLSGSEALVVIPDTSLIYEDYEKKGVWGNKMIVRIIEDFQVSIDNNLFKVWLRTQTDDTFYYKVSGRLFQYALCNDLFIGLPRIQKVEKESLTKLVPNGKIEVKRNNSESWTIPRDTFVGSMKLRFTGSENEVLFVKTVNILPKDFSIELRNEEHDRGQIILNNSDTFSVAILSEETIDGRILKTDKGHIISLNNITTIKTEEIVLELSSDNAKPLRLCIPVPKENFNVYNSEGEIVSKNSLLNIDELQGYRLFVFNNKQKLITTTVRFELIDPHDINVKVNINRKISVGELSSKKKPLIDYFEDIQRLLSFGKSLDAKVFLNYGNQSIGIRSYSLNCYFDLEVNLFKANNLLNRSLLVEAQAFRVDRSISNDEIHTLEFDESEDAWRMPESFNNRGNWLIYPAKSSKKQFRPILAPKEDPVSGLDHIDYIYEAGLVKNSEERIGLLTAHFNNIAIDFEHSSWNELNILWENSSHVPCKTFDVWNALVKSEVGLVTAFLLLKDAAISNLTEEYTINWLLIPVKIWLDTMQKYKSYLDRFNLDSAILDSLMYSITDRIKSELNLSFVGLLIEFHILSQSPPMGFMLNEGILKSIISDELMGQQNRAGLIGRHTLEREWPDALQREIVSMYLSLPKSIKQLFPKDLISYSKSVVYLPAIFAFHSVSQEGSVFRNLNSLLRYRFHQIIEFDQVWHYDTYNYVQGYYWNLINKQPK